jgi:uncharacterized protein (TIGR04255 family)
MDSQRRLPKFRRPPVTEVVHGVQFERLPLTIVHPGLFYERIRPRFPRVQTVPALPPLRPTFDLGFQPVTGLYVAEPDELPRAWFIAEDDSTLVQFQNDRLLFNWRHEPSKATYPHFEQVHESFGEVYLELERFVAAEAIGNLKPQVCEMTYINHIRPLTPDGKARPLQQVFRLWHEEFGPEWQQHSDGVSWNARYVLRRDTGEAFGRLTSALSTVAKPPSTDQILQLDITVVGQPTSPDRGGIAQFHSMAHEKIVNYFAAITTKAAHNEWERIA